MGENLYIILAVIVTALCTYLTRAVPYLIFKGDEIPAEIGYLSKVFPSSIMIILVIFCIKHIDLSVYPNGAPELISVAAVAGLQYFGKNLLISIVVGTLLYMALIGFLF